MNYNKATFIFCFFCFYFLGAVQAQERDSLKFDNTILPIAFFLPETSLGLGVTGITTFRKSSEALDNRPSQFLYSAVYTFKKQLLFFFPFEIYTKNNHRRIKGELGYYRYFYNYYGTGSQSRTEDVENYSVNFPRFDLSYALTKNRIFYLGAGFKFDHFDITEIQEGGLLDAQKPIGYNGGYKLNAQLLLIKDKRDNILSPSKGTYFKIVAEQSLKGLLTEFNYWKLDFDFRYYFPLKDDWVLASRINSSHVSRNAPFFDMVYISSPLRARGFSDRRFIARNIVTSQFELRYPIIKRLKGSVFVSPNMIYNNDISSFDDARLKVSGGIGIRYELDKTEKTRIRLDVASGDGDLNFYLTMNEAF